MDRKKLEQVLTIVGDMHDALAFKNAGDGRAKMRIAAGLVRELLAETAEQPANPAGVTKVEGGYLHEWIDADGEHHKCVHPTNLSAISQPHPAIGAGGQAVAFQQRVQPWMMACFGPEISADKLERSDRLAEEVLELLQSGGYPRERVAALTDYVYEREIGEPAQEVGGVMVTLAAYCLAHDLDMHECGETELARIWTKVEKIRAKQAAKPTGSALPSAHPVDERAVPVPVEFLQEIRGWLPADGMNNISNGFIARIDAFIALSAKGGR